MASTANRLGATALRSTFRIRPRRARVSPSLTQSQTFHRSQPRCANDKSDEGSDQPHNAAPTPPGALESSSVDEAFPQMRTQVSGATTATTTGKSQEPFQPKRAFDFSKQLTPEEVVEAEAFLENPPAEYRDLLQRLKSQLGDVESQMARERELESWADVNKDSTIQGSRTQKMGLMAMGEDPSDWFPDEPYEGDDITTLAHSQLDQHRDLRQYMRIIAWDMPKLRELAKPFEPPSSDRPLRFRYTSYMGETHPAENKVVLEFCTIDLPLKPAERLKLIKLVGPRYDPQTDLVKMSCESFSSQLQNKRYLGDLVGTLMQVAKGKGGTAEAKDSFADVPVDFRHVRWKQEPKFPEAWKITPERRRMLQERRIELAAAEQQRIEDGSFVNGLEYIAESYQIRRPEAASLQGRVDKIKAGAKSRARPTIRI